MEAAQRLKLPGYDTSVTAETKRFVSDTGELSLDYEHGLLTINTPNAKSAVGFLSDAGRLDLGGLTVDCQTNFASITATTLDGKPIGSGKAGPLTRAIREQFLKGVTAPD